uniref:Uncharacterized protein ycf35 n=1 Tax=Polysiphonia sertularioides TaxID=945028 RepID=A0A1Z1M9J2_9FLOR|nr:hypothetical protein [Polysiphonia sertularioides]ARW62414.1 hypothetical protein [Polysiphonia sertularioides]
MSHFSKIRTNIIDLEILKKTVKDLGFSYSTIGPSNEFFEDSVCLFVYNEDTSSDLLPVFHFEWNGFHYSIVADLGLWNLDIDFEYFMECLLQKYAYNTVISQGLAHGFCCVSEKIVSDGSVALTLQRF